ncbi:MAG: MlaD family protein [Pseudomonadota bacterium]|jgi:phospholipid/cholesterol/gamma-HCH transport system substrate-binding protein
MKRENINYTLVGLVVLAALGILIGTLFAITGRSGATASYLAAYRNVTGLSYGAPVFYEGFRIGQVETITPVREGGRTFYRVELTVRRDWPIPADSVAQLAASGLLADISIAIREGTSAELLAPGSSIPSREGADVFAALNELAGEVTDLTRTRITPLVDTLSRRVDSIAQNLDAQTPLLLTDAAALLQRLNDAAESVNLVLGPSNRGNIDATLASIRRVAADLEGTRERLDQLLADAGAIAAENRPVVRDSIRDLSQITTALARRIDAIAHNLESSSRNVDEFTREIRKSPNRLLLAPKADEVVVEEE